MKANLTKSSIAVLVVSLSFHLFAGIKLLPEAPPQRVFSGRARAIQLKWTNSGPEVATAQIAMRILATSSGTAMPVSQAPWKKMQVLPEQTVLESAKIDFPDVRTETRFLVQWIDSSNQILGITPVLVSPTNLLKELGPFAGVEGIAIYDPQNELKPLLEEVGIAVVDLSSRDLSTFTGRLGLIGPFGAGRESPQGTPRAIEKAAQGGMALVLVRNADSKSLTPAFYSVISGKGAVVVAKPELFEDLTHKPLSQLNLLRLAEMAVHRVAFSKVPVDPEP
jgi:hypothetical protein